MPKRYFEILGERMTLELDVTAKGMSYSVEKIEKMYGVNLKELDKKEFNRLTREYTSN
ncbi:hypothetical protein CUW_1926 [Turicibacter sanguinis PC909]|uniref:Uncharacterized protein n=1 Tax=Turicibacter sanguinis PC909 TaxID=702450 RepID=A0ABM9ZYX0_9FIRM|nr:hypothetical protein [Turicibacter sanguinis]EFF62520.1 hypothetical protein CUW_1926 [Turicibacter sanguinis PC909]